MHARKRKIVIALLALGTVLGFGHGFASMRGRACARRDTFEKHVAELCVDAARKESGETASEGPPPAELAAAEPAAEREGKSRRDRPRHRGPRHGAPSGSDSLR